MTTELANRENGAEIMEAVIAAGDLAKLTPEKRVAYYSRVCASLGLNPFVQPFQYITLNGKLTLYATRTAADQLRKLNGVSISKPDVQFDEGLCVVSVTATTADGRSDSELGVVTIEGLKGDARANAIMKAITKAKRRVTLSIVGLGWLDETEIETIPSAQSVTVDHGTGEIQAEARPAKRAVYSGKETLLALEQSCHEARDPEHIDRIRDWLKPRWPDMTENQRESATETLEGAKQRVGWQAPV